jgi:hypothetical protein
VTGKVLSKQVFTLKKGASGHEGKREKEV